MVVNLMDRLDQSDRPSLLRELRNKAQSPFYRIGTGPVSRRVAIEGSEVAMFGSNNYLGLASDCRVIEAGQDASRIYGNATTGSRLLNGSLQLHVQLENEIANWFGAEGSLLFSTGYAANIGCISSLVGPGDLVVVDSLAHASIRDGVRLSGALERKVAHNSVEDLCRVLDSELSGLSSEAGVLIIVDGLYSMEGSLSPLGEIVSVAKAVRATLMVDEAHSIGLYGAQRRGWADEQNVLASVDVVMGSLSKGIGSTGGFIAGSSRLIEGLRGTARSVIFSTSSSPSTIGSALEAIRIIRSDDGAIRAAAVKRNSIVLRQALETVRRSSGLDSMSAGSPVVPVVVGDDYRAIESWNVLFNMGIYAGLAIYPAVPRGEAILRLCVTSEHSDEDIMRLAQSVISVVGSVRA